jgi:hypothetical protein
LHDKDIIFPHAFANADKGVVIAELKDLSPPAWQTDVAANRLSQIGVGIAAKDGQLI